MPSALCLKVTVIDHIPSYCDCEVGPDGFVAFCCNWTDYNEGVGDFDEEFG